MSDVAEWEINADLSQVGRVAAHDTDHALDSVCYMMGIHKPAGSGRDIRSVEIGFKDGWLYQSPETQVVYHDLRWHGLDLTRPEGVACHGPRHEYLTNPYKVG